MASINQVVSEIANALQQPLSVPLREAARLSIIHNRARLIRHSFEQHHTIDKSIQQRFRISLIDCPDGDIPDTDDFDLTIVKRSAQRVPVPVRLNNGIPFLSVRTAGTEHAVEIPYITEIAAQYYKHLPGCCPQSHYDFINQYIYIGFYKQCPYKTLGSVIVEAPFENPFGQTEEHYDGSHEYDDDDEFMISEDIIGDLKKLVMEEIGQRVFETNEIPTSNLVK